MLSSSRHTASDPARPCERAFGGYLDEGSTHAIMRIMSREFSSETKRSWPLSRAAIVCVTLCLCAAVSSAAPIHTTYLWHMHQPIYWPDESTWTPGRVRERRTRPSPSATPRTTRPTSSARPTGSATTSTIRATPSASILDLPDAGRPGQLRRQPHREHLQPRRQRVERRRLRVELVRSRTGRRGAGRPPAGGRAATWCSSGTTTRSTR